MNTIDTKYYAAYYIPHNWIVTECSTREQCLAKIEQWREECKFEYPMKLITTTTTEEEIPAAQWEGRLHGSQDWEDIWPEHDGQMSYGADITYVEIRRKGSDALT